MNQTLAVFSVTWARILQYRADVFLSVIGRGFSFLFVIWLWGRIFSSGTKIAGVYDYRTMVGYYLMAIVVRNIVWPTIGDKVRHLIKYGELTPFLLRPYEPLKYFWLEHLSRQLYYALMTGIILLLIGIFGRSFISLHAPFYAWIFFILFLVVAIINLFWFDLVLGTIAFWTTDSWGISKIGKVVASFLTGEALPLDIFPLFLRGFAMHTPFAFATFWPIKILQSNISLAECSLLLLESVLWVGVFWGISSFVWRRGIRRFEAVGA